MVSIWKKKKNTQKGSGKIGFKGNWKKYWVSSGGSCILTLQWKPGDLLGLSEKSVLFDKYTVAQEEYFPIRNFKSLQEEY